MIAVIVLMIASVLSIVVTPSGAGESPGTKLQASVRKTAQNSHEDFAVKIN